MPMSPRQLVPRQPRPLPPSSAPRAITGTSGDSQIALVWQASSTYAGTPITDYRIQYSSDDGATWTTFSRPASSATSATVTGLTNATSYLFRVAAMSGGRIGPFAVASHTLAPFIYDPAKLTLVYDTSKEPANNTVNVPLANFNVTIDWGDGTSEAASGTVATTRSKTYSSPGIYVVQISGTMTQLNHTSATNRAKLVRCLSFGNLGITSLVSGFNSCANLVQVPLTVPPGVTNVSRMFNGATSFNQPIEMWNTSSVTTFGGSGAVNIMFSSGVFNQSLGGWSLAGITTATNTPGVSSTGMSEENYSRTLIGWATQAAAQGWGARTVQPTTAGTTNRQYSDTQYEPNGPFKSGLEARLYLTAPTSAGGRGWTITGDTFVSDPSISATEVLRQTASGSTENVTVKDAVFQRTTNGTFVSDFNVTMLAVAGSPTSPVITSSDTSILTNPSPQSGGLATFVSPGTVVFTGVAGGRTVNAVAVARSITDSVDTFQSFASGSLAANAVSAVDSRLAGKSAGTSLAMFTAQNHTAAPPTYTRNASFWAADVDLTCCSVWNSTGLNTMAGTLISPRHIAFAAHYQISTGATVRFVAADGTVVNRTMTAKAVHPSFVYPFSNDIAIGVLDSDVPAGVSFARVLPANFSSYLPTVTSTTRIPVLVLDQEEKGLVLDLSFLSSTVGGTFPTNSQRLLFAESIIVGDSGNPVFLIVNGQPVLISMLTSGGQGFGGTNVSAHYDTVNSMMTSLGGGYQLTAVDLSGFPAY